MARPVVVLVEDDPEMQEMVQAVIKEMDSAEVTVAGDVASAMALVREVRPALVIVDDDSPPGSAQAVMDNLSADPENQFIPVVALTHQRDRVWALTRQGVAVCLRKPFDAEDLADVVEMYTRSSEVD